MANKNRGKQPHSNSLKNLVKFGHGKDPNEAREAGLEVRRKNAKEREAMKLAVAAFKDLSVPMPDSETVLKIAMAKAIAMEDMDEATRLATLLMPYEKPKLASQEVKMETTIEEKSDEELQDMARSLGLVVDNTVLKEPTDE